MATPSEIKVNFSVGTADAIKNVDELNKKIEETTNLVDKKGTYTLDTADSARGIKEIRKAIKDLQSQALELEEGSAGFIALQQKAADLKDKMEDLGDATKALKGTGIEKLKGSLGLLKESFANLDFSKAKIAFKGLGGAMKAIPIFLVIEGLSFLMEKLQFFEVIMKPVEKLIQKISDALYALTDAIGLTNKGAQDAADKSTKAIEESSNKQTEAIDRQIKIAQAQGKNTADLELQKQYHIRNTTMAMIKQLEAAGELNDDQVKQLKELKKALLDSNAEIEVINAKENKRKADEQEKANKEEKDRQEKANKEAQDRYRKHQDDLRGIKDKYFTTEREKIAKSYDEDLAKLDKTNKAELKLYNELLQKKKDALYLYDYEQKKKKEDEYNASIEKLTANHELELELIKDYKTNINEIDSQFEQIRLENSKLTDEQIYKLIKERYQKQKELNDKAVKDAIDAKQLELNNLQSSEEKLGTFETDKKVQALNKIKDKRKEILDAQMASELANVEKGSQEEANIREKYRQENVKNEEEAQNKIKQARQDAINAGLDTAGQFASAISSLDDTVTQNKLKNVQKGSEEEKKILKQAFNRQKAFQLVQTAIDGARAVVSALATGPDPVTKGIMVATAIATTAASMAAIASKQYNETGGGGGGTTPSGGGGGGGSMPGAPTIPQNAFTIGQATLKTFVEPQAQTQKVYVTEGDIRTTMNKVQVIENRAVIR